MTFTIFPAIDLRKGQVVRLQEGDPSRQTDYGTNPAEIANKWLNAGAKWLHVVNLDGAFEEYDSDNIKALKAILKTSQECNASVQFGGGIRNLDNITSLLDLGVNRVILGTVAINKPSVIETAISKWGDKKIALGIDARDGIVQIRGWMESSKQKAIDVAKSFTQKGLRWLIFTDIARDGMQTGLNIAATKYISENTNLNVIASGGVKNLDDVIQSKNANLAGVIIGKALYEGTIDISDLF